MIKLIGTAYKRDDYTTEEFFDYWFDVHAPISASVPNLRGYTVTQLTSKMAGDLEVEAFVEQWYDNEDDLDEAMNSEQGAAAWEDVQRYAKTTGTFWVAKEHIIIPPPDQGPGLASTWGGAE